MQIGPYRVLEEIARGGMGVVYRARRADGREVALKLLRRPESPLAERRQAREVQALSRLRHPHVVSLEGAGVHEGQPWLALELVAGETLEARLRRGPLSIADTRRVATQLAGAVSYLHTCGVLHRDLKPDNVLLRGDDALLTDFGLTLDLASDASRMTHTGALQGTPGYWAPEQARGEKLAIGTGTDVYGLGAVLFACLTARPPVEATTLLEHCERLEADEAPSPRAQRAEVPRWLDALCRRCLARDPAQRPASAEAVRQALGGPTAPLHTARSWGWALAGACGLAGAFAVALLSPLADEPAEVEPPSPAQGEPPRQAEVEAEPPSPAQGEPPSPAQLPPADGAHAETAQAWSARGRAASDARDYARALEAYERALALDPRAFMAHVGWATSAANLDRHADAVAAYGRALELAPHAQVFRLRAFSLASLGRAQEALRDCAQAEARGEVDADLLRTRGYARSQGGDYAGAVVDYDRALALEPDRLDVLGSRGYAQAQLGRYDAALADFARVLARDPDHASTHAYRGACLAQLGRYTEALAALDRSLELEAAPQALSNRAACKMELGDLEGAAADLLQAQRLAPQDPTFPAEAARCLSRLGRHDLAIPLFDRALALAPADGSLLRDRGRSRSDFGDLKGAEADFDRALALDPQDVVAYRSRALARFKLGRYADALADCGRGLEGPKPDAKTLALRGMCLTSLGRAAESLADYDLALKLDPREPRTWANRGRALADLGRCAEALADYDEAERLDPSLRQSLEPLRARAREGLAADGD
ncbi:MAG: tetratricopeptide repeat protein [Planctomycetota bacterium]